MSIDIVKLIENTQNTKFNSSYQSKLIEKVKNNFNEFEQQLFLANFYCYLNYDYNNDYIIDLDNIWKWLGFSQKVNAKSLLEKNFILNKDYKFIEKNDDINTKKHIRGGHNKDIIMLNIRTFKLFCIKTGTTKSGEIQEYFIKQQDILQEILMEQSNELKEQLDRHNLEVQELENKKNIELKIQKELEREKFLLKEYATAGSIVYIIKIKNLDDGQYIIKIGESRRGIKKRYNEHKTNYGCNILLLDCFKVDKSKDFESFIHNHINIKCNKVKNLEGHENENELFLVGNNLTYHTIIDIINSNIYNYNYTVSQLLTENELLKEQMENKKLKENQIKTENNDNINNLLNIINNLTDKFNNLEQINKDLINKIESIK